MGTSSASISWAVTAPKSNDISCPFWKLPKSNGFISTIFGLAIDTNWIHECKHGYGYVLTLNSGCNCIHKCWWWADGDIVPPLNVDYGTEMIIKINTIIIVTIKIKTITIILDEDIFRHLAWTTPPNLALGKEVWPEGGKKGDGHCQTWISAKNTKLGFPLKMPNLDFY